MTGENPFGELLQEYVVECLPLAEQVADAFVELERRWRDGDPADEGLAALPGPLHTIKGNSAMMGLAPMREVAHALEDACGLVARHPERRGDAAAALLVAGGELLVDLVRQASTEMDPSPATQFVERVRHWETAHPIPLAETQPERRRTDRRGAAERVSAGKADSVVRVDFRRLDALLEVLGEGLIQHSALAEAYRGFVRRTGACDELDQLDQAVVALEKTLKRLESTLMETRLLPLATAFGRFPRMVRDTAEATGKRVRLVQTGMETPLDKAVLDRLSEPLLHLVSNAIVHGMEPVDARRRAGKPDEGTVRLDAAPQAGRVVIRVSDDGRGLDEQAIRKKAEALGQELRPDDVVPLRSLIFLPGLSTAERVSTLAGRGVGLDVVANAIHALGGTIDVETAAGKGTTFILSLPVTLAIVRSLIVEVDQERFAVPLAHVAETVRAEPEAIREINHRGVTQWRGGLIHVADGGALLGTGGGQASRRFYVVMAAGPKRRALLVDRLVGHQDVVVKGLDPALGRPDVVSGTTILGDGRVACIVDAVRILEGGRRAG
ncbi:MAG TPA: chemotaxis protein CheW [Gemmatimonadales bacterium]|nr:chemotaxis protein CheW [Gemmatimonadales bacterium]